MSIGILDVFLTVSVWQQFLQMGTIVALLTLKNSSTATGGTIIVVSVRVTPSRARATEIGPTVSPSGTAMLAPKLTRY
jgi:hypothetical protein